ncbi:MAG TPA: LytTR family DNA-binding domain-containing protein [Opitutaceae bacterium]
MFADSASSAPLRILVVDDEPAARRGVKLLLDAVSYVEVIGEVGDGPEAVRQIEKLRPDIVFLDVQMPGCDGFEVIQRVGTSAMPAVVFVTAYDEHALRAFDVSAVDYLLKPYEDARFHAALARAREEVRRRRAGDLGSRLERLIAAFERAPAPAPAAPVAAAAPTGTDAGGLTDRILIKSSGEIYFLKMEEIDWIEAEGDYMKFHAAGRAHLLRETMARLEARLDPRRFIRIHRSTIVNVDRVRKMSPAFAGEYAVILHDGTKLRLSRGYQDRLQEMLRSAL